MRNVFTRRQSEKSGNSDLSSGMFVPKCDKDGRFSKVQCWDVIGVCWCVGQHDGKELAGTRMTTTADGKKPDCFRSKLFI